MKKTLFKKYFSICSSIILLSTAFLGVVLLVFASQYFKDDKYTLLSQKGGGRMNEMTKEELISITIDNYMDLQRIKKANGETENKELDYQLKVCF